MLSFPYLYGSGGGTPSDYVYTMSNTGLFQYPANVKIPSNVTELVSSTQSLYSHPEIETVEWEADTSMTTISQSAFSNCTGLTEITIPDSVTTISSSAFSGCTGLADVNINTQVSRSWGMSAFSNCSSLTDASTAKIIQSANGFSNSLFEKCRSITTLSLPYFANYCFRDCTSLQSVTISAKSAINNSVQMFKGCTALSSVTFTDDSDVKLLSSNAFDGCTALQSIDLPETLTTIGSGCFAGCTALQSITVPHGVTTLAGQILAGQIFYNCSSLAYAYLPNTVTSGASGAASSQIFYNCTSLTNIELEEGWNCNLVISSPTLTGTSLKAMFESLYDLTGGTAKTLTLGTANFATAYSTTYIPEGETEAVPIATIAANKNWTLTA